MRMFVLYGSIRLTVARLGRTVSDVGLVLSTVEADIGVHVDAFTVDIAPVNVWLFCWLFCLDICVDLAIVFDDLIVDIDALEIDDTDSVDVVDFVSSEVDDIGSEEGLS